MSSSSYAVRANFLRKTILVTIVLAVITAILVPVSLTSMPRSSSSSSADSSSAADDFGANSAILPVGPARAVFPTATSSSSNSTTSLPPLATTIAPISIADANIYFTPLNWFSVAPFSSSPSPSFASLDGAYRQTTCVGAYFRFKVTGTRQAWIAFDQTNAPATDYMSLRWYIDTDPTNLAQFSASTATPTFASSSSSTNTNTTSTSNTTSGLRTGVWYLPSSLTTMTVTNRTYTVAALPTIDPYTAHTIFIVVRSSDPSFDRWLTPQSRARVVSLLVDAVSPTAALLPVAAARYTTLLYSDSVGEGMNTLSATGAVLDNSDVSRAFWFEMARRLNTDVSVVAYQHQGYTIGGLGNVPMLMQNLLVDPSRDGIASMSAWSYHDQTNVRVNSSSGATFVPRVDCIMVTHGAWDAINALANPSVLVTNVYNTIAALRQAAGSATTNIVIVTPFGGYSAGLILKAFNSYKAATGDVRVSLVDISPLVSTGLNQYGTAMPGMSYDGLHPAAERSATIGQQLAQQVKALYA